MTPTVKVCVSSSLRYPMMDVDHETLARALNDAGFCAEVRGDGASRFVFTKSEGRAAEISAADAGVWVEFWDVDDNPTFDRTYADVNLAMAYVRKWLAGMAE